jgi:hypothetical protein
MSSSAWRMVSGLRVLLVSQLVAMNGEPTRTISPISSPVGQ